MHSPQESGHAEKAGQRDPFAPDLRIDQARETQTSESRRRAPPAPAADKDKKGRDDKGPKSPKTARNRLPQSSSPDEFVPPPLDTESATVPVRSFVK